MLVPDLLSVDLKGQGTRFSQVGSGTVCVYIFLCGTIFLHCEGGVKLLVGEGILCMLGRYNDNIETGKNGDRVKIGVEAPEETNSKRAAKMAGVNGP